MRITTLTAGLRRVIGFLPFYLFPVLPLSAQPAGVTLDTLHIRHIDFHGKSQTGILICNKSISKDLQEIFAELYKAKYPIERIRPISEYGDDDEKSMSDNNTSCYCYRVVEGSTTLSNHARGQEGWHTPDTACYRQALC